MALHRSRTLTNTHTRVHSFSLTHTYTHAHRLTCRQTVTYSHTDKLPCRHTDTHTYIHRHALEMRKESVHCPLSLSVIYLMQWSSVKQSSSYWLCRPKCCLFHVMPFSQGFTHLHTTHMLMSQHKYILQSDDVLSELPPVACVVLVLLFCWCKCVYYAISSQNHKHHRRNRRGWTPSHTSHRCI